MFEKLDDIFMVYSGIIFYRKLLPYIVDEHYTLITLLKQCLESEGKPMFRNVLFRRIRMASVTVLNTCVSERVNN